MGRLKKCPVLRDICPDEEGTSMSDMWKEPLDGLNYLSGFIIDKDATEALWDDDFRALGCEGYKENHQKAKKQLVESGKFPIIRSGKYPQHCYMTFYGPVSKLAHVIMIPFGSSNNDLIMKRIKNRKTGAPVNTEALNKHAEILCGGYRPGGGKITTTVKRKLVGRHVTDYGTIGSIYFYEEQIVS